MDRLIAWLQRPIDFLFWLGLVAGFLMMAHVTVDVACRYLLNRPLEGTTEIVAAYYMVVVAYLPWAWLARHDRHIVAGVFQRIGTPRFDFWLEIAVKVVTIVYVSVFTYQTLLAAIERTRSGEVWLAGTMYLPVWPSRWMLPIAGASMVACLVLRVLSDIAGQARRSAAERT
ncbi:MAG TPA: TRAP transporter small permease [Xanthobacteraceae bacterium]|jgi:TRAP-type C4-dicarboxylate transport system permease small subunit